jgi:hypothetical protein
MDGNAPRATDVGSDGKQEVGMSAGEERPDTTGSARPDDPADNEPQASEISGQVIIDPGNPFDFEEVEIAELIGELEAAEPRAEFVAHFRDETEYGGALIEVLHVWTSVEDFVNQNWQTVGLISVVVNWLRKRWKRDKDENPARPRPRSAVIYDQDQRCVFDITIDLPDGEPVPRRGEGARHGHRRPSGGRRKGGESYDQGDDQG